MPPRTASPLVRNTSRAADTQSTFSRLFEYLRPYRGRLVLVIVLALAGAGTVLVGPWLIGVAIDDYVLTGDADGLARISAVLAGVYLLSLVAQAGYARIMATVAQRVMQRLRADLFDDLQKKSMTYFDRTPVGDLMSRLTNDVDAVDQMLSQQAVNLFRGLTTIVGLLVMMFWLDWQLALAAVVPLPVLLVIIRTVARRGRPRFIDYARNIGSLDAMAEEQLGAQRVVVSFDRQGESSDDFDRHNERARIAGTRAQLLTIGLMPLNMSMGNLGVVSVAGIGSWMAIEGYHGVTVGLVASFITYAQRITQPLTQAANSATAAMSALAGAERVFQILDDPPDIVDAPDAVELPDIVGHVEFRGVDFAYQEGEPILHGIDLDVAPGQVVGLVGPTGAGKTTIINILTRFYDVESGEVLIDGHDLRDVTQDSLRHRIAVVTQDTFLFTETVRENIRFGRLDADDDEIIAAARMANAHHFIQTLPDGYDTVLSEGGSNLSLGQRQLLAIARAVLADKQILILDEATSSVDTRTERAIQDALLRLMEGRTSFVIAHRLSTVRDADVILVLDGGRIVQRGNHDELMEEGGLYQTLVESQFAGLDGA